MNDKYVHKKEARKQWIITSSVLIRIVPASLVRTCMFNGSTCFVSQITSCIQKGMSSHLQPFPVQLEDLESTVSTKSLIINTIESHHYFCAPSIRNLSSVSHEGPKFLIFLQNSFDALKISILTDYSLLAPIGKT